MSQGGGDTLINVTESAGGNSVAGRRRHSDFVGVDGELDILPRFDSASGHFILKRTKRICRKSESQPGSS